MKRNSDKENQRPSAIKSSVEEEAEDLFMAVDIKSLNEVIDDNLFDKLKLCAQKGQEGGDTVRTVAGKIHARMTCSDKKTRDRMKTKMLKKNSNALENIIDTIELCKDNVANFHLLNILRECLSSKAPKAKSKNQLKSKNNTSKKLTSRQVLTHLVNLNGVQVLLQILLSAPHLDTGNTDQLVQEAIYILGQLAPKDPKFVTKVKNLNAAKLFHTFFKVYYNQDKILLPMLTIIKCLSKNTTMVQVLVRDGIAATFEKAFIYLGFSPRMKLKTLMECLKHMTTSRICCTKFVKFGIVSLLMRIFERWDRFDGQLRLKICNAALSTLQHLGAIKAGRKAIKSNNGLQLLYRFCVSCPEDKAFDCLLSRICAIINQCLEKSELSVPEMSPAKFSIPGFSVDRAGSVESNSDMEGQGNSGESINRSYSDLESGDEDDSFMETSERKKRDVDDTKFFSILNFQRSAEELACYNVFFRELTSSDGKSNKFLDSSLILSSPKERRTNFSRKLNRPESIYRLTSFSNVDKTSTPREIYCSIATNVRSIIPFFKVAYPDMIGAEGAGKFEPLNNKDRRICRSKLLACVDRGLHSNSNGPQQVVYDLDALSLNPKRNMINGKLGNWDDSRRWKRFEECRVLQFESRFESGNLRKVIQIAPREYELILTPDVNSASRHQWFYFEVSNMEPGVLYTFNIVNCEKSNSQFNFGMKPNLFSVVESKRGTTGWVRTGVDICYYRNCYRRPGKQGNYLTTSFSIVFPYQNDVCYLAYHFPYTYSHLMANIWRWSKNVEEEKIYFRADPLCDSLNGNEIPLLTITSPESANNVMQKRRIIFLTSRVHPGESNSSWVMHGTLEALLSNTTYARSLRDDYIFKIVPMLNIEGVINGCNRYGLTNEDLNRRWSNPNPTLHPAIYHTKGLMEYCSRVLLRPPFVFVDYHGHSRRKNVFLFGCSSSDSWSAADRIRPDNPLQYLLLPHLMQKTSPAFALPLCSFKVERYKEATARVAVWRQLGVARSYTMESSFCGCDQGPLAGYHLDTKHLREIGDDFCKALALMKNPGELKNIDKSTMEEYCCPLQCIVKSCKKPQKCIQDRHAKQHIFGNS